MSLTQVSRNSRREESQASAYTSDEDEDSSVLAHLVAMFPSLDHDVIVSVLQAHDGRLQAAVEYLMGSGSGGDHTQDMGGGGGGAVDGQALDPARDMVGLFSDDIGGLPEMLPTFLFDQGERTQSEDDDPPLFAESLQEEQGSPLPPQDGPQGFADEPLPTYEEACEGSEIPQLRFPHVRELSASGQDKSVSSVSNLSKFVIGAEESKKKKKGKKVASKLKPRKSHTKLKYRAVRDKYRSDTSGLKSNHQPYQAFVDDDELDQAEDGPTPP